AAGGITGLGNETVTLTDVSVSVADANIVDAATSGVITATITAGTAAALAALTGTGNAYTTTVSAGAALATDLNLIDAATTAAVDATAVTEITGAAADIAAAISSASINTAGNVLTTVAAGTAAAADLLTIDANTSTAVDAALVTTVTGTGTELFDFAAADTATTITANANYAATFSGTVTYAQLAAVDAANGAGVLTYTTLSATAAEIIANAAGYTGAATNLVITDGTITSDQLLTIDAMTTGVLTYNTVTGTGAPVETSADFTAPVTVAAFDALTDVVLVTGVMASSLSVAVGADTVVSNAAGSVTLTGYTTKLSGSEFLFDDGSLLKTNIGGIAGLLNGGNVAATGDLLVAGSNGDTLRGFAGADKLVGGAARDFLYGGTGADTLIGGAGNDYLNGGDLTAQDMFVYFKGTNANGSDIIQGFDATSGTSDKIAIDGNGNGVIDASSALDPAIAAWYFAAAQSGADTMVTLYDGSGLAPVNVIGEIRLMGVAVADVTAADFVMV
ncbi:MAG: hypothetical protein WC736_07860, partial [Gallionella sp.]